MRHFIDGFSGARASYSSVERIYLYIILECTEVNNGIWGSLYILNMSMTTNETIPLTQKSFLPYVFPFALFAVCIYAGLFFGISPSYMYPLKTVLVAFSLIYFWNGYKQEIRFSLNWLPVISGVLVFLIWIFFEGMYPKIGQSAFNPYKHASGSGVYVIIIFRMIGAVLVVPLMEELFWRSFALRFIIKSDFKSIPLGQFSWFSFIFISILFGLEHERWLVGILAGMVYSGVLYRSKNLFDPILSHATTNLLLGIYVLSTHQWSFW